MLTCTERTEYKAETIVQPLGSSFSTTLDLTIKVPISQEIMYRPGMMETIKFAWVQYVMVLIPCLGICNYYFSFLFTYRILEGVLVSDLKSKRKIV